MKCPYCDKEMQLGYKAQAYYCNSLGIAIARTKK